MFIFEIDILFISEMKEKCATKEKNLRGVDGKGLYKWRCLFLEMHGVAKFNKNREKADELPFILLLLSSCSSLSIL